MTREIEFRAWDKLNKIMIYHGIAVKATGEVLRIGAGNYGPTWTWADDLEPLQYTGLKDKNGKKMFEGDIIKSPEFLPSLIKYDNDYAMFIAEDIGFKEYESEWEIIGNIHQNPELLKPTKVS